MKKSFKWIALFGGGLLGNAAASMFLIKGEGPEDKVGIVAQDDSSAFGADDYVRVGATLGAAWGAWKIASIFLK